MGTRAALAGAVGLGMAFVFQSYYSSQIGTFTNIATPVLAGIAVISAGLATSKYAKEASTRSGKIWASFTLGILLWFLGEATWSTYTLVLNVPIPYPSLADVFYLAGYFPLLLGLSLYVMYFRPAMSFGTIMLVVGLAAVAAAVLVSALFWPLVAASEPMLTLFFDFTYPLLDLMLLAMAVLGLAVLAGGKLGLAWLLLAVGILLNVFGDLSFSYATARNTYTTGNLSDFMFLWGYLAFALAFYHHRKEL